jgi:hypothetical protein
MNNNVGSISLLQWEESLLLQEYGITKKTKNELATGPLKLTKAGQQKVDKELFDLIKNSGDSASEKVKELIKLGANVNYKEEVKGDYPLLICARKGYDNLAAILICAGADVNLTNNYGTTALMAAARHDNLNLCKVLVILGASINAECKDGDTALFSAKMHGNSEVVEYLIQRQAYIHHTNEAGKSILDIKGSNSKVGELLPELNSSSNNSEPNTHEDAMKLINEAAQNLGKTESEIETQPQEESTVQNESGGRQRTRNARLEVAIKKRSGGFTPNITPESRKIAADILTKV